MYLKDQTVCTIVTDDPERVTDQLANLKERITLFSLEQYADYKIYSPTAEELHDVGIILLAIRVQAEVVIISNAKKFWPERIATCLFHQSQRMRFPCPFLFRDSMGDLLPADITGRCIGV